MPNEWGVVIFDSGGHDLEVQSVAIVPSALLDEVEGLRREWRKRELAIWPPGTPLEGEIRNEVFAIRDEARRQWCDWERRVRAVAIVVKWQVLDVGPRED